MASDLVVDVDERTVFTNFDKVGYFENASEITFKRASIDKFLFRVACDALSVALIFLPENTENGLWLGIGNVPDLNAVTIGQATDLERTLSFD